MRASSMFRCAFFASNTRFFQLNTKALTKETRGALHTPVEEANPFTVLVLKKFCKPFLPSGVYSSVIGDARHEVRWVCLLFLLHVSGY